MHKKQTTPQSSSLSIPIIGCFQTITSEAQRVIWSTQSLHHDGFNSTSVNNIVIPLMIKRGSISITNIRSAVVAVLERNTILRTAIYFDEISEQLIQEVQPIVDNDNYSFGLTKKTAPSADEIIALLNNESTNDFAQLDQGLVARCHFIQTHRDNDTDYLNPNDMVIFVFHRIAFDHHSIGPFLLAFKDAYNQMESDLMNLQYMDFTLYEYTLLNNKSLLPKINEARQFYLKLMHNYNPKAQHSLPTTSTQNFNKHSGRGHTVAMDLDSNLVGTLIEFVSSHNVSMFQMGLACFFGLIHELSNCSINDFCVACSTDNRSLLETKTMIGTFVHILPYRIKIELKDSLMDILKLICELSTDVFKHAQLPYQVLMSDANVFNLAELPFHFKYYSKDPSLIEEIILKSNTNDGTFCLYTDQHLIHGTDVRSNDLTLTMIDNYDEQKIQLFLECSADRYDERAALEIRQWFKNFLTHLFTEDPTTNKFDRTLQPIAKVSPHIHIDMPTFSLSPNDEVDENMSPKMVSTFQNTKATYAASNTELKKTIVNIWQEVIHTDRLDSSFNNLESNRLKQVPTDTNKASSSIHISPSNMTQSDTNTFTEVASTTDFASLGGDSLRLVQVYQHYQLLFNLDIEQITTREFFKCNTIDGHVQILDSIMKDSIQPKQWRSLHIDNGIASFAQERIFLDEQLRFSNKVAVYNELIILQVLAGSLSTDRLQRALQYLFSKHKTLRTSLIMDHDDNTLKQCITDEHQIFALVDEQTFKNENELRDIIYQTAISPYLFDLSSGRVFHCQLLRQQKSVDQHYETEIITNADILIITFHHVAFDLLTSQIFLNDLCNAYNSDETWSEDGELLKYIDYSAHERVMDMSKSCEFWILELEGYNMEHQLLLPVDRHRPSIDQRSGSASVVEISFDDNTATAFLNYASSHQLTLFQLGLSVFFTFLFKLTHGQRDMCISSFNANRYRTELQNMIGMFVATLPYRIPLDSQWSFDELVKHVREKCLSIFEHSHYPLKHILTNSQQNSSNIPFLETVFDFITVSSNIDHLSFDGANLEQMSLPPSCEVTKSDFMLRFVYDSKLDNGRLSCRFICSRDLFDETTVATISRRFQHLFEQLISSTSNVVESDEFII